MAIVEHIHSCLRHMSVCGNPQKESFLIVALRNQLSHKLFPINSPFQIILFSVIIMYSQN